ncbi:WecB/TagA/CpsF family glycosyltransferase [Brachyspira hyodysenteriae]|uniref:UDP-N-acetyl-D-mannosamine transferase n=3 Tax=Brachyspira hyodysenteriae TaxID=159 RepID=A0A3B6VC39_BRAHW|nr:WecB/TagA/CpsF family glycosyltransferase [Brachyspira hyodysenteriae]ACN84912.1 UDP-N-acetyl-D-mannosamine transferase [Brachyspira hyodysenteriae WA1]ANN63044.1 UDP-N-acetyl-D-mannosamine transferase [Brachyspira hyodysenteriae ATCC 27164]AUJ50634.1 UDP-N-acetyl-D-mannosamine transferase [Brachyspira hyodysenteriae]KLI15932.1 UDP-N-acetyl-D-mannosamine transferase [Brachyspira hyodysenteriae]KLI16880.1 UDP-N-acetyl-D-mannosamine transferase [Brachyspira hyodysenteriae]
MIQNKSILGIRIDSFQVSLEEILDYLKYGKNILIISLDVHQLLKIRYNKKLKEIIKNASLVIAAHPSIAKAYKFIHKEEINYINEFILFSKVLDYIEQKKMSMFLFGDEEKYFFTISEKIKKIYPGIYMLGNYQNTKDKEELDKAFIGFKKIEPDVFLMYMEFKKSLYWFNNNKQNLDMKFFIPFKRPLDSFAGKIKAPSMEILNKNKYESFYTKKNIFRIFLYIDYLRFWILVLFEKLTTKKDKQTIPSNS